MLMTSASPTSSITSFQFVYILAFTDISSVYPHGRLNLLVQCVNSQRCKPLVIEGVRVKARKKHPDEVI